MIKRSYKVNIPRNSISTLRKQLKEDKSLNSSVSHPPKSDKIPSRITVIVKANVHGTTEIEVLESTIKFNEGVVIGENHTGKLSKKIEFFESIKKNWIKLGLLYLGLAGSNIIARSPDTEIETILPILGLCVLITFGIFYSQNIKFLSGSNALN